MEQIPELLMPAGSLSKLRMALRYGADAVYVGAAGLSMRPDGVALDAGQLAQAVDIVHQQGKRIYVAVNSLLFERDLEPLAAWIDATRDIDFDAVILSDLGAWSLLKERRPDMAVHISTQLSTANTRAARFLKDAGAARVILARECSLAEASQIAKQADVETEIFVHGAMCMAVSGRCLLSAHLCGSSGSAGQCKQTCRWDWQLVERKRPGEAMPVFEAGGQTIFLGSKDLCLIEYIPQVVQSGVCSVKVEGRMKSEYYAACVARVYRAALDRYAADPASYTLDPAWLTELAAVSHRPYDTGFAFGYPEKDPGRMQTHNRPISSHQLVGYVRDADQPRYAVAVKNPFSVGDTLEWIGPGTARGAASVERIVDQKNRPLERTISATTVMVSLTSEAALPRDAILRRPV